MPRRVALFGELLQRLAAPLHKRFVQCEHFDIGYSGGEANTGVLLANFGIEASLVSAVPDSDLGQACINWMRRFGLDTRNVQRRGPRLGIYYLEQGAAQRQTKVIYDRAGSSFSQLKIGDVPWEEILRDADWLHFTGTAPGLSGELAELTLQGCQIARAMGRTVSCDLNYRSALWTVEEARPVMMKLAPFIDVLIANEEHARLLLNSPSVSSTGPVDVFAAESYGAATRWLREQYGFREIALTMRSGSVADQTSFAALLDDGQELHRSRIYDINVVDRIGAGDAFTAGLIFGLLMRWDSAQTVEFAAAAGCLKHTVHGDFCLASFDEVALLARSGTDGRVLR